MAVGRYVIFLGPSLDLATARGILAGEYRPPAQFGSIYNLLASDVKTIVLIDGVFHTTPSVWQREILAALHEGIAVIGASSMGALRAAELQSFGMVGVGQVFEWYRNGVLRNDDAVALRHATGEHNYQPLSEPLVNIRATLEAAVAQSVVGAADASALLERCVRLPYPERGLESLGSLALALGWSAEAVRGLEAFLPQGRVDIKRQDAIAALRLAPEVPSPRPVRWVASRWDPLRALTPVIATERGLVTPKTLLSLFRRDRDRGEQMRRRVRRRFFVHKWLQASGRSPPNGEAAWCNAHAGERPEEWRRQNGLGARTFSELAERHAWCEWAIAEVESLLPEAGTNLEAEDRFVVSWAHAQGVTPPTLAAGSGELAPWIVDRGPGFFGYAWDDDAAVWQHLQIEGQAALLARTFLEEAST
jgi:hypothetical protein